MQLDASQHVVRLNTKPNMPATYFVGSYAVTDPPKHVVEMVF